MKRRRTHHFGMKDLHKQPVRHWKDMEEMHRVMQSLSGPFRAVLLDIEEPVTKLELMAAIGRIDTRFSGHERSRGRKIDYEKELATAVQKGVLELEENKYRLTPGGLELAQHMRAVIPQFFRTVFSERTVSILTIAIHFLLSIVKLSFGFLSRSAGLTADGIDNTVDTFSSILAWVGIKYKKDRLVSLFIILMMIISFIGIALTSVQKVLDPAPVKEGVTAFIVSAASGLVMMALSAYQYMTGKRTSNFAIMCQSVDSRNHFLTSLLVCAGILISYLAGRFDLGWLHYSDAIAAMIIGFIIIRSTIELILEFRKPDGERAPISHFIERAGDRMKTGIVLDWLKQQLAEGGLSDEELSVRFQKQFCDEVPAIQRLTGVGYAPKSADDLKGYLDRFCEQGKIVSTGNRYLLKS